MNYEKPLRKPVKGFRASDFDLVGRISDYESGKLSEDEVIELFQHLVDTGLAWTLQGSYGRTAVTFLEAGLIHKPEDTNAR
jgi:hypothetical protein